MTASLPTKKVYTSIPPTTDTDYWTLKSRSADGKTLVYVPIDRDLDRQIKLAIRQKKNQTHQMPKERRYGAKPLRR